MEEEGVKVVVVELVIVVIVVEGSDGVAEVRVSMGVTVVMVGVMVVLLLGVVVCEGGSTEVVVVRWEEVIVSEVGTAARVMVVEVVVVVDVVRVVRGGEGPVVEVVVVVVDVVRVVGVGMMVFAKGKVTEVVGTGLLEVLPFVLRLSLPLFMDLN